MFWRILVCLDGSRFAEQILSYIVDEARRFGSKVVLLQVVKMPMLAYVPSLTLQPAFVPPTLAEEQIRGEQSRAESYLNSVASRLRETGLDVDCVTVIAGPGGFIGDTIISYATANEIALIAMSTHGYTGCKRLILGSITNSVLKNSSVPVMVIKPQDSGRERTHLAGYVSLYSTSRPPSPCASGTEMYPFHRWSFVSMLIVPSLLRR